MVVCVSHLRRYAATRGLLFSHMGWIFFKPSYEKLSQVDRDDLDNDPGMRMAFFSFTPVLRIHTVVVRFQHEYYGESMLLIVD
jgi:stearoyl-CoA desaturase (delta-9 desaturase)